MNNQKPQKPVAVILLLGVICQGLYLLVIGAMTVLYKQVITILGGTQQSMEASQPYPYLTLGGNALFLLLAAALSLWICRSMKADKKKQIPSILLIIVVGLVPSFSRVGSVLEQGIIGQYRGVSSLATLGLLSRAFQFVYPLCYAGMVLSVAGAALALYRRTEGGEKPVVALFRLAFAGHALYLLGIVLITLFQQPMRRFWTNEMSLMNMPAQIPAHALIGGVLATAVTAAVLIWISACLGHGRPLKAPCICALVYLCLYPFAVLFGNIILQMSLFSPGEVNTVVVYTILMNSIRLLSPLLLACTLLLAAGTALALYRQKIIAAEPTEDYNQSF